SVGGADGWTLTDWFENVYLSQAGPEKYDQLAAHEIQWTDPSVKDALPTLAEIWGKKDYLAGGPPGALQPEVPAPVTQALTVGDTPPVVSGGDAAVILKDSEAAQALATFLASPDAASIQTKLGGYLSPNKNVPNSAYPNEVQRTTAKALIDAGDDFRFDMSDQAPQAFGGTPGKGEWKALQDFLKDPSDIAGTQRQLEADAAAAYGN